jgi:hypothetical protein
MPRQEFHADLQNFNETDSSAPSNISHLRKTDDGEIEFVLRLNNELDVQVIGLVQSKRSWRFLQHMLTQQRCPGLPLRP